MKKLVLTGQRLSLEQIRRVAHAELLVSVPKKIKTAIIEHRERLLHQIHHHVDVPIYGTNRLHGDLKDVAVSIELIDEYQTKYIKVHNCGTGDPLSIPEVRGIMLIRLNSFLKDKSGVSWGVCQMLVDMLNKGVTPLVLEEGSVGASGDLIPLAMIGATMIGLAEAEAYYKGRLMPAQKALELSGLKPIKLGAKEAMGLTNGSNFIASVATLALLDAKSLLKHASISAALSLEAIRGEKKAFGELINEKADRHPGQIAIAKEIRALVKGSNRMSKEAQEIKFAHERNKERVQDRYSFRCAPQIHGAAYEAIEKLERTLEVEVNSVTDNPLFDFEEKKRLISFASGGNFHGQSLASPIDYVKAALTTLGIACDKRTFSLLDENLNYGIPGDLALDTSKADGGYMIAQYAGAARVAENRVLSTPASVMSVSTAANQEDVVSMGSIGAIHLRKVVKNLETIVSIELLCATRALQLTEKKLPKKLRALGVGTSVIFDALKKILGPHRGDVYIRSEIEKIRKVIQSRVLLTTHR